MGLQWQETTIKTLHNCSWQMH